MPASPARALRALYLTTLLLQAGTATLNSWAALRGAELGAGRLLIGGLMAANALGLLLGGLAGYRLIGRFGHVRAYAAGCLLAATAALAHELSAWPPFWLALRFAVGLATMCLYMVVESWINEQAAPASRGRALSWYMAASFLGLAGGQAALSFGDGGRTLGAAALAFAFCFAPILFVRRNAPRIPPAAADLGGMLRRAPQAFAVAVLAGLLSGAFHGLAPVYARAQGLGVEAIGLFMAICLAAGLIVQVPLGLLSDRLPRMRLIFYASLALVFAALPLLATPAPPPVLMICGFLVGLTQFSLYPLALALANDRVEPHERLSLAGVFLAGFGLGGFIGPLAAGAAMERFGDSTLYGFFALCGSCAALTAMGARDRRPA